ncbi:ArgP/LysG family DNA-binding transcriptional regulator [Agromyces seonyuensis]|uniref:ArgP/LysG family DNA-binding transcriptional regulator n=1 Tax=Agromyces seonyuensis TaxID=2662446 RepID=A0A6I4NYY8_9MICO|nr:ArgP/LysG family DNA-binding transcriptional regulator [Agromyces seonyuensis]MWB99361.1 ArgP/LysG family DNA-binding transcriptional regulator [Agromyces seonyuensis]
MEVPLDLARTLAAVVDAGTFDAAATALALTPSAVSQRVKALENRLGRVLVARSKPVRPTEAGAAIVRLARQLALLEHDALAALGEEAGDGAAAARRTSLALAVNADSLGTWILPPLARVAAEHPVVFDLHRDDQDRTAGLLASGIVSGAVTSRAEPVAGCVSSPLGVMRYEAFASPALLARAVPTGAEIDFSALPLVEFDRADDLQRQWLAARGVDADAPPRHFVPASNDFARAIVLGLGWGLLPGFQSAEPLARGELVPLGGAPVDVALHWQQWNLASPLLDVVAAELAREARTALA